MRLDVELVSRGLVSSRNKSASAIKDGSVKVNGIVARKPSAEVFETDKIEIMESVEVSRAAKKLRFALAKARSMNKEVEISGNLCLDIGASTGGFVSVLLEENAAKVVALDVGRGQLVSSLKEDKRVVNFEGMHILDFDPLNLFSETPFFGFKVITCDVSFISLKKVLGKIKELLAENGVAIVLIKPQFEVGREILKTFKNGVITDERVSKTAAEDVLNFAQTLGFKVSESFPVDQKGLNGNQEFCAFLE